MSSSSSSSSSSLQQQQQPKEEEEVKKDGRIVSGGGNGSGSGDDDGDEKKKKGHHHQQQQQQPVVMKKQPVKKPLLEDEYYYENYSWNELPNWIKDEASILGYNKYIWDNDKLPFTEDEDWIDLSTKQKQAAIKLGYNQETWDTYDSDSDNDTDDNDNDNTENNDKKKKKQKSSSNYIVYCIQLYTQTKDYKFIINQTKGLCMVVNRFMKKDELIIQSPVGPTCYNDRLFKPPSPSATNDELLLSPERREFAEDFLKWQDKYSKTKTAGITRDRVILTLDDFKNPRKPSKTNNNNDNDDDIHTPTEDSPEFCFDNLTEKDVVVVEFVSPQQHHNDNDSNYYYMLPPERRFEILPYDECIGVYGEENYQPSICQRPPTLFYMNGSRTLTIPGHFVNHACLDSATAYDAYRLLDKDDDDDDEEEEEEKLQLTIICPRRRLVAPAQPKWVQKNLDEYVNNGRGRRRNNNNNNNVSKLLKPIFNVNALTTYHSMEPGDEVTTDYALFHWSNEDCIPNGPNCFEPSTSTTITTTGDDEKFLEQHYLDDIYEGSGWLDPWFHCCCGNKKCHSKYGFRGVKFFPLDLQKRLYWVCTPWIQNQIDWKLYKLGE